MRSRWCSRRGKPERGALAVPSSNRSCEDAEVRNDEGDAIVQADLHPRQPGRVSTEDHIELVDGRQNRADNQSDPDRAAKSGRLTTDGERRAPTVTIRSPFRGDA